MIKNLFYDWYGYNQKFFVYINYYLNVGIIPILSEYIYILLFVLNFCFYYLLICVYWIFYLKKNNYQGYSTIFNHLIGCGLIYTIFMISYTIMKFLFALPRPFCSLDNFITKLNTSNFNCMSSFPSAHTGLIIIILYTLRVKNMFLYIISIAIVGGSRIVLSVHYPADILYSILISFSIIFFVMQILIPRLENSFIYFILKNKILLLLKKVF